MSDLLERIHSVLRIHLGFLNESWLWERLNEPIRNLVLEMQKDERKKIDDATRVLTDGLRYHEHDGHDLPKRVVRDALQALGVPRKDQP